jgi:hypothetical protein
MKQSSNENSNSKDTITDEEKQPNKSEFFFDGTKI